MKPKPLTVADIAQIAGVSKSTVSRALNDSDQISDETKAMIRKIAENQNVAGSMRKTPRGKHSRLIGVGIPVTTSSRQRIAHPFNMELLGSIGDTLNAHGYNMVLSQLPLWSDRAVRQFFEMSQVQGFIIIGQAVDPAKLNEIAEVFGPMVVWGSQHEGQNYLTVGSDNSSAAETAVRHLINIGCKRIAFLGDIRMPESIDRFEGYKRALKASALPLEDELIIRTSGDRVQTYTELSHRLQNGLRIDGLFTPNDVAAMNSIRAIQDCGLSVPDDVSVVGFDDIDTAEYYNPPLTTVRQDVAEGGSVLVEKIVRLIAGEQTQSEIIPAELIIRSSCGAGRNISR